MLFSMNHRNSSWLDPFPSNLGKCTVEIPFKSAMIPFHVVISSLLSLSSHSFSFSNNSCRNSFILRVPGVIMPRGSKVEAEMVWTSCCVFACSMFSSFFVHMENLSVFSLLHLIHAIACTHTSTCTTSLMNVKNSTCHFCLWHLLYITLKQRKWKKEQKQKHQV